MRDFNKKVNSICKQYLDAKTRPAWYEITAVNCLMQEVCFLDSFANEDVCALKSLREKYGAQEFVKHLEEVFDDPSVIRDLTGGLEIVGIDLDVPCYKYKFGLHELTSSGKLYQSVVELVLSDDSYLELLRAIVSDAHMNMNSLKYANRALFDRLSYQLDSTKVDDSCFSCKYPYIVTFDEANNDVEQILKQHPDLAPDPKCYLQYPFSLLPRE